jgi:hypothetical protein
MLKDVMSVSVMERERMEGIEGIYDTAEYIVQ